MHLSGDWYALAISGAFLHFLPPPTICTFIWKARVLNSQELLSQLLVLSRESAGHAAVCLALEHTGIHRSFRALQEA